MTMCDSCKVPRLEIANCDIKLSGLNMMTKAGLNKEPHSMEIKSLKKVISKR